MAEILSQISTISTIVVMMGGMVFGAVKYINSQTEKSAKEARQEARQIAEKVQKETREYADSKLELIRQQIENIDSKVETMLSDLKRSGDIRF